MNWSGPGKYCALASILVIADCHLSFGRRPEGIPAGNAEILVILVHRRSFLSSQIAIFPLEGVLGAHALDACPAGAIPKEIPKKIMSTADFTPLCLSSVIAREDSGRLALVYPCG